MDVPPCAYERFDGAGSAPLPSGYRRHEPEQTLLHQVVRGHLLSFLADARANSDHGMGLPRFVERELERYLACGVLAHGFARIRCAACGHEALVGFSCKGRGVCPSCGARRMVETAAHLVDRVLPRVPMRQWVLAFPPRVRLHLAYDARLCTAALTIFVRALFTFARRRARQLGLPTTRSGSSGAVTFVQRFGSALQLTPHFHTLVPDGVFVRDASDPDARPSFHRIEPPTDDEVARILGQVSARVVALLVKRGRLPDPVAPDACAPEPEGALAGVLAAAVRSPRRRARAPAFEAAPDSLTARKDGFSLDADRLVREHDRQGLEQLCRYGLRPAVAAERLSLGQDGLLRYRMKRTFSDGSREIVLSPAQLLGRLAALVPPPRVHQVRYHGVFAPRARGRAALTGQPRTGRGAPQARLPDGPQPPETTAPGARAAYHDEAGLGAPPPNPARVRHLPWTELLRRVHRIDVLVCPRCQGPLRVLAFLTDPTVTAQILRHLGLPADPPTLTPARAPPQTELDFAGCPDEHFVDPPAPE